MNRTQNDSPRADRFGGGTRRKKNRASNPYLAPKAKRRMPWAIPVILVCALFFCAGLSVTRDYIDSQHPDIPIAIVIDALFLVPIALILLKQIRNSAAARFADKLESMGEYSVELSNLDGIMQVTNAASKLKGYVRRGLIENVVFDYEAGLLILPLNSSDNTSAPEPITIECPGCGATLHALRGVKTKCEYCGREF